MNDDYQEIVAPRWNENGRALLWVAALAVIALAFRWWLAGQ